MCTLSLDFDGVWHTYEHGWHDGSIYGALMPGADTAVRALMGKYSVVTQTCRTPLAAVADWIMERTGIPTVVDPGDITFWTRRDRILVTNRKLPAMIYIDDRGYRFEGWDQTLLDLPAFLP